MSVLSRVVLSIDFIEKSARSQILPQEVGFLLIFFIMLAVIAIVLYIAGVIVVGKRRALLSDAFVISLLGIVVLIICLQFFGFVVGGILSLIVWLLLIRHYYETGWLGAIAVGIMALIVATVVLFIIGFIFLGISILLFKWLPFISIL